MSRDQFSQSRTYPPFEYATNSDKPALKARIKAVCPSSPADDAGIQPGDILVSVDGHTICDYIDWLWYSSDAAIEISIQHPDQTKDTYILERDFGTDWGIEFEQVIFDKIKQCRNACTFCFMHQLPKGLRPSLYLRDDDFRLSFLAGTFVTLTNCTSADEKRIKEQCISPLRMSLQAYDKEVRKQLIGKHADHGLEVLKRLLDAGIIFHMQIVLVPGINDGEVLQETLEWAYAQEGIENIGIVPLGYTKYQTRFSKSYNDPGDANAILDLIAPLQKRALDERGHAWVYAADELYRNAYPTDLINKIPPYDHYGDFSLYEDGIGIIRTFIDEWQRASDDSLIDNFKEKASLNKKQLVIIAGKAQYEFLDPLIKRDGLADYLKSLYVSNTFFGGNVDVTGLLCACDIVDACRTYEQRYRSDLVFCIPQIIFNDEGLTLDGYTLQDINNKIENKASMVSCSPYSYFQEMIELLD